MSKYLMAGVGRVIITPPIGIKLIGYNARIEPCVGVENNLTATVAIFSDNINTIAIAGIDVCMFLMPTAERIRAQLAGCLGIHEDNVMLNFSHTHSGPLIPDWWEIEPDQKGLQEPYQENLENLLVGAAQSAREVLRSVRLVAGSGQVRIGVHRREWYKGKLILGEDLEGPIDPEVKVVRVDTLDGSPYVVLFSYGCHSVTLGPQSLLISPDYPGVARRTIEKITNAKAIFLQGAAGDINPITGVGAGPVTSDIDQMNRLGNMLAGEVIKVHSGLRTHNRRGKRKIWESISIQSHWPFEPIEDNVIPNVAARTKRLRLSLQPLPDLDKAKSSAEAFRVRYEQSIKEGDPEGKIAVDRSLYDWAQDVVKKVVAGDRDRSVELLIQAFRINDVVIVGIPGEPFSGLGIEVKRRSPYKQTIFLGYTNGWLGYFPTVEAFPQENTIDFDVYRIPDLLYQNALLPAPPTPQWPRSIVEGALDLLGEFARVEQ